MSSTHANEDAAAYHFLLTVILIVIAAIVWAFLQTGLNPLVSIHNAYVAAGHVSVQSHSLSVWSIALLVGAPGITIIGLWIAAVVRSIEVAQAGNQW